jgi:hypothetical protein
MALPVIKHPTYKITIPSTKKEVNIRPFTVQEEKILLMAKSSENTQDIVSAVKQVIRNCIVEPVDVDAMATFDIEYIFIKLRAKSVGEVVDLEYTDPETEDVIKFKINLDDVEVKYNPEHNNKINVFDDVGIVMRYPTLEEIEKVESSSEKGEEAAFKMLMKCIETIYDQNNVYSDYSEKELTDFIDSLPMESMNKVKQFFDTIPSVEHEVNLKSKDGKTKKITLKGITSFFT